METQAKGYQRTEAACLKRGYALATIFQSPAIWAPCRRHRFLCCIQGTRAQRCIFSSSAMVFGGYVGEEQFQGWVTTYDWPQPSQSDHLGSSTAYSMPAKVPQRCSQLSFRHSRMELRPPTARKSHPNFFAHCKRSTNMKKYKKTIIPNVQNTMRTQVTPMVSNYGKLLTTWHVPISKHHVNAWFMYVWVKNIFLLQN